MVRLPTDFWLVVGSIASYSSVFYTFLAFGNIWLSETHGYSDYQAGHVVGIVSIFSMVGSPLLGVLMDRYGGQRRLSCLAMCGACCAFAVMGFFPETSPYVTVFFAGACYAVLPAALYPLLTELVPDSSFTIVYGVVNSLINMFLTAAYYTAGWIINPSAGTATTASDSAHSLGLAPILVAAAATLESAQGEEEAAAAAAEAAGYASATARFKPLFLMFCCITGIGIAFTGRLLQRQSMSAPVGLHVAKLPAP